VTRISSVTYEDVARACSELQTSGQQVSVRRILAVTGGSSAFITESIRRWRADSAQPLDEAPPQELATAWVQCISRKISEATSKVGSDLKTSESIVTDLQTILGERESELEKIKDDLNRVQDESKVRVETLQNELTMVRAVAENAEKLLNQRIEKLEEELRSTNQMLMGAEKRASHAEGRLEELSNARDTRPASNTD
jgi:DNA repair exonuclease SbcCD ATPase subunit